LINPDGSSKTSNFTAMVLNNTCDLQPDRSSFVTVAPVVDFIKFAENIRKQRDSSRAQEYLRILALNRIDELLYIPECPGFERGTVVHLDRLSSMSVRVYEKALAQGQRTASFSQCGFYYLLMKVTHFLARAETFERPL
jgi:hypothetical protein